MPKRGDIAYCKAGNLGLILSDEPNSRGVWTGIHLEAGRPIREIGDPWQSACPAVIGNIGMALERLIGSLRSFAEASSLGTRTGRMQSVAPNEVQFKSEYQNKPWTSEGREYGRRPNASAD